MRDTTSSPSLLWWGQIVDDNYWKDNCSGEQWKYASDIPGYGKRYRVAILGRDCENKDVPDSQLEWVDVGYPVTAGSGHGGSYQTSNLRKGAFVVGTYKDGINMSEPMILVCYGNNHQIPLSQTIPNKNFVPFSGYIEESVAYHDIAPEGSIPPRRIPIRGATGVEFKDETAPTESCEKENKDCLSNQQALEKAKQETPLLSSSDCDKLQLGAIQIEIKNFIQDIQNFKAQINSWKNTILKPIRENGQEYSVEEYINYKAQNAAKFISGGIKTIITFIQEFVTRKITGALKDTYDLLPPDLRSTGKSAVDTAMDLLMCLFRKIINNLFGMILNFLLQIAERYINAPLCAVENLVAGLLGKLTGLISSAISAIMAPLNAIFGVFDIVGDIIGFITDVLTFLSCEEPPSCPDVTAWSLWDGATQFRPASQVSNIINKVKTFASNVQQSVDPDNFNFDLDFSDIFQNDTCNVGPIFCGPPTVQFYGGGGSGAAGNAIINAAGDILGVDLISFGSGYTDAPLVKFVDVCGKGKSASGRVILANIPSIEPDIRRGTLLTTGGDGGVPVSAGGSPLNAGGDGGIPATAGGIPVTAGGTGGTPVTAGGTGGTGGTGGIPVTAGGTGGTPVTAGGTGGTPVTAGGDYVVVGGDGTPVTVGGTQVTVDGIPVTTLNSGTETTTGVVSVVITDPGFGYPRTPDGDRGGDGRVWANKDQTTVKRNDGKYDRPYNPGETVSVNPGDEVYSGGVTTIIEEPQIITAPEIDTTQPPIGDFPSSGNGQYPVVLEIDYAVIDNPGINYSPDDEMVVIPDNGAVLKPTFDGLGSLIKVDVVNSGIGFTEFPEIKIRTKTGYNAKVLPVFRINKDIDALQRVDQDQIISVIDCVGRIDV